MKIEYANYTKKKKKKKKTLTVAYQFGVKSENTIDNGSIPLYNITFLEYLLKE